MTAGDNGRRFFEARLGAQVQRHVLLFVLDRRYALHHVRDRHVAVRTVHDQGKILEPVLGWTNHHSIVEFQGKWYLFYHDAQLSGGQTHLRNIKVTELTHRAGRIDRDDRRLRRAKK